MPRNRTPVVTGTGAPLITRVVSPTVNGLNAFWIGTLMPAGLKPTVVPGVLNGSGVKEPAPRVERKKDAEILKWAITANNLHPESGVKRRIKFAGRPVERAV